MNCKFADDIDIHDYHYDELLDGSKNLVLTTVFCVWFALWLSSVLITDLEMIIIIIIHDRGGYNNFSRSSKGPSGLRSRSTHDQFFAQLPQIRQTSLVRFVRNDFHHNCHHRSNDPVGHDSFAFSHPRLDHFGSWFLIILMTRQFYLTSFHCPGIFI